MDISKLENRAEIEEFIMMNMDEYSPEILSVKINEKFGLVIDPHDISDYIKNYIKKGKALITNITKMVDNALSVEIDTNVENATRQFSLQKINEEFDMIYKRIKALYELAQINPEDPSYDKRIVSYLERANALRITIQKDFISEIKNYILMDIGKRIILSAIANFIPYIPEEKRMEAKDKFMLSISHIINNPTMQEPDEIKEIKEEYGKTKKEEN